MAEIIKCYRQNLPALRLIGRKYDDRDRLDGSFGSRWGEWFQNGWFDILEKYADISKTYEDANAYVGLMRLKEYEPFTYWIGMFLPEDTPVPEGFSFVDIPESDIGTCWICGKEQGDNIYGMHDECIFKLSENGFSIRDDFGNGKGEYLFFERYGCPRFTTPDAQGNIILDYCVFIKGNEN